MRWAPLGRDLAIDLGTATTQVHVRGRGVVVDEPSLVAVDTTSGRMVAAGEAARDMLGRTPERVLVLRPLSDGVITDYDVTEQMLRQVNDEDARVAEAVRAELPRIARAVDMIADALRRGGRLIYVGAGTSGRLGCLDAAECLPTFGVSPETVFGIIAGGETALLRAVEGAEDDADAGVGRAGEQFRRGRRAAEQDGVESGECGDGLR